MPSIDDFQRGASDSTPGQTTSTVGTAVSGARNALDEADAKMAAFIRQAPAEQAVAAVKQLRAGSTMDLVALGVSTAVGFVAGRMVTGSFDGSIPFVDLPTAGTVMAAVGVGGGLMAQEESWVVRGSLIAGGVGALAGAWTKHKELHP